MCPTGTTNLRAVEKTRKPDLRSAFDVLDVDRDGKISPDDLRTFYGDYSYCLEMETVSSSEKEEEKDRENKDVIISSMISVADENKDGFVEYEEFEKVLVPNTGMNNNYLMENVFRVMDKDGDGKVGYEDLKSYLVSAGFDSTDDEDVKAMIRLAAGAGGGGGGGEDDSGGVTFDALLKILFL